MSSVREEALSKIDQETNLLKKAEVQGETKGSMSILDVEVVNNANTVRKTVSLNERLTQANSMYRDTLPENVDIEKDVSTDGITINNGDVIRIVETKALNSAVTGVGQGAMYGQVGLEVSIETGEAGVLELSDPKVYNKPDKMVKREKVQVKEGQSIRNCNPFSYNLSTIIPLEEGNFDFFSFDGFNHIQDLIEGLKASLSIKTNKDIMASGVVGAEEILKNMTAIRNKSSIRKFVETTIEDDVDMAEARRLVNGKVQILWDKLGIKPLTAKKIVITLSVNKIHIGDPGAFTSARSNVSILNGENTSMKIERLSYTSSFSLPIINTEEVIEEVSKKLIPIETYFTIWANNEAAHSLGRPTKNLPELEALYNTESTLYTTLGLKAEDQSRVSKEINDLITNEIKMEKIKELGTN